MVQLVKRASDVRTQEINLSSILLSNSTTSACIPVISSQGSLSPMHFTNGNDFMAEYGNPDPSVSMTIQSALNYFAEGNDLWGIRVTGTGTMVSGALLKQDVSGLFSLVPMGVSNPANVDITTLVSGTDTAVAFFYASRGPGSYGDNIGISIQSMALPTPTFSLSSAAPSIISGTSGYSGTSGAVYGPSLPGGTYSYTITALTSLGESEPATIASITTSDAETFVLAWPLIPGAIGYKIYGRAIGASPSTSGLLAVVGGTVTSFVDNGTMTPNTAMLPPVSTTPSTQFVVSVYDTSVPSAPALETWTCTLGPQVSSSGVQLQMDDAINPFSSYIQVINGAAAFAPVYPALNSVAKVAFTGGNSGTAPTSYNVAAALQVFTNKQIYGTNIFINGGLSDPIVQLAMDTLVQYRGDAVALLDTPSDQQHFQQAVDYRNLQLNLNSTYSALFNPDVLQADLINGKQVYNPPSGWAAALCARTDRVANQAFSIAGLNRGILNVLKTRYTYDDGESTIMYDAQVNYIRTFVGKGIALWEQQTLSAQDSALSWLSVRRIINVIKTSLYGFLLYSLQEMNSDQVRRQIVNSCNNYLDAIQSAQGLSGFKVVCDDSNNTPTTFNAGVLVVSVVLIPMIPIHEIQLQCIISKSGVSFNEVLSAVNGNTQ